MSLFVFVLFIKFAAVMVRALRNRAVKSESLCTDCLHAHVQYGANGRRAISCTYGGAVRLMTLDVLYCTDYLSRNLPSRARLIGFVHGIAPAE